MSSKKKQGFAAIPKDKHLELSARGGRAQVPKGLAKLDPKLRSENAVKAANARWEKVRQERQVTSVKGLSEV